MQLCYSFSFLTIEIHLLSVHVIGIYILHMGKLGQEMFVSLLKATSCSVTGQVLESLSVSS